MKCITSPTWDDTQIISYVEGEADEVIVAHVKKCPYCADRVNELTLMQNRLRARYYRATCPSSMDLGDYHLGLLPESWKLVVAQHVRECPHCRREVAELDEFLAEPGMQADDVFYSAKVLFARLIGGSESALAFEGLRGKEDEPFIYQAGNVRIVIGVWDDVEQLGLKTMLGLVTGLETNDFTIQVNQGDPVITTTAVDEIGNFIISHLAPGYYELILTGPNMKIHIQSLLV